MKVKNIVDIIQKYNLYQQEMLNGYPKWNPTDEEIAKYRAEQFELYKKWLDSEV